MHFEKKNEMNQHISKSTDSLEEDFKKVMLNHVYKETWRQPSLKEKNKPKSVLTVCPRIFLDLLIFTMLRNSLLSAHKSTSYHTSWLQPATFECKVYIICVQLFY